VIFGFLEIFQKPPGGIHIAARRLVLVEWFWVLEEGTAWLHIPSHQATQVAYPVFWVLVELSGGDEHLPGDSSQF